MTRAIRCFKKGSEVKAIQSVSCLWTFDFFRVSNDMIPHRFHKKLWSGI